MKPSKNHELDKEVGGRVRRARERRGIAQNELGRKLKLEPLYRHEAGLRAFTLTALKRVCEELDVSAHFLLFGYDWTPKRAYKLPKRAAEHDQLIDALIAQGRLGVLELVERLQLAEHLDGGGSRELYDLEFLVMQWRYKQEPSEKTLTALHESQQRRAQALRGARKKRPTGEMDPRAVNAPRRRKDDAP